MLLRKFQRIDFADALNECASSQQFFTQLKSGRYIFVDSYFCLNRPEYVQRNENGVIELTAYARTHLAECCLSFVSVIDYDLDSDANPGMLKMTTNARVSGPNYREEKEKIKEHIERFQTAKNEILAIAKKLPIGFPGTLDKLIEWRGVTEESLAEASALTTKTIQRLRNYDPDKEVSLETVIQLCIGLQLHPILSGYMLRAAGKSFMTTNLHIAYQVLLSTYYEYSIDECNSLLKSQRLPTLGRRKNY